MCPKSWSEHHIENPKSKASRIKDAITCKIFKVKVMCVISFSTLKVENVG